MGQANSSVYKNKYENGIYKYFIHDNWQLQS